MISRKHTSVKPSLSSSMFSSSLKDRFKNYKHKVAITDIPISELLLEAGQTCRLVLSQYVTFTSQRSVAVSTIIMFHLTSSSASSAAERLPG